MSVRFDRAEAAVVAAGQLERLTSWDAAPDGDLRILVSVDDGGLRAVRPLCRDAIMRPDGSLVGD